MRSELQQRRIEADRIVDALEHCGLEVIVEDDPRHRSECVEGLDMTAQEVVHRRAEIEAQEDLPRVGQHHDERHQWAHRAADGDGAEMSPVGLRLLTWQGAQTQVRFARSPRPHLRHDGAEMIGGTGIAALFHHLVQPARAQRRIFGQRLDHERDIRRGDRGPYRRLRHRHPGLGEHPPHGAVMHAQLGGDGADQPVLAVMQAQDLGFERAADHRSVPDSRSAA